MVKNDCVKCTDFVNCRTQIVYPTPCHIGGLLAIGEAPGRDEDIAGEGFVGTAGKTLDKLLSAHKISRNDYGRANICRCRPPQNRKPTTNEINACLPYLAEVIINTQPKVILTIGGTPTSIFCGKGSLYSILSEGWRRDSWAAKNYINCAHPEIKPVLQYVQHIVPSPHTSPLAFNRNCPSGEKWAVIAARQVKTAVSLL
ncbi:MAG: uracil-DNA glycosylase [Pseudomonadota bacterium]|nr:uracil-DNA glycosylase [Pseudomonadota bacterium]